jgi:hypothetical protein
MSLDIRTDASAADPAADVRSPAFATLLLVLATVIAIATVSVATVFLSLA